MPYNSPNLLKFSFTAIYGVVQGGLVCSPVQVWAPFVPTAGFHISTPHPLCFMFTCNFLSCNICTMPDNTSEFAQICVNHNVRRGVRRLALQSRTVLGTVCIDCGFSCFNSPSSFLYVYVHFALVQHLFHAGKYPSKLCKVA